MRSMSLSISSSSLPCAVIWSSFWRRCLRRRTRRILSSGAAPRADRRGCGRVLEIGVGIAEAGVEQVVGERLQQVFEIHLGGQVAGVFGVANALHGNLGNVRNPVFPGLKSRPGSHVRAQDRKERSPSVHSRMSRANRVVESAAVRAASRRSSDSSISRSTFRLARSRRLLLRGESALFAAAQLAMRHQPLEQKLGRGHHPGRSIRRLDCRAATSFSNRP